MHGWRHGVEPYLFNKSNKPGVSFTGHPYNLFNDVKTSAYLVTIALLLLASCQNKSVQLPGIFGKWEIVQIWNEEQEVVEFLRMGDKISLMTGQAIDFNKDNHAYFYYRDTLRHTVKFNYSGDGIYLSEKPKAIGLTNILTFSDTMVVHMNDVVIKLKKKI